MDEIIGTHTMRAAIDEKEGLRGEAHESRMRAATKLEDSNRSGMAHHIVEYSAERQHADERMDRMQLVASRTLSARKVAAAGEVKKALEDLTTLVAEVRSWENHTEHLSLTLTMRGRTLMQAERSAEAVAAFEEALRIDSDSVLADANRVDKARALHAAGVPLAALLCLDLAISAFRERDEPGEQLGVALWQLDRLARRPFNSYQSARTACAEAVEILRMTRDAHPQRPRILTPSRRRRADWIGRFAGRGG